MIQSKFTGEMPQIPFRVREKDERLLSFLSFCSLGPFMKGFLFVISPKIRYVQGIEIVFLFFFHIFQILLRKQSTISLVCLKVEWWHIIQKIGMWKTLGLGGKISSWILVELLILLINWVSTSQTSLNPSGWDGSTCFSNSMENMTLKFYSRIQKGTLSILRNNYHITILFSFTKRSIFHNHQQKGNLIRIDRKGYSLMIDYYVSMR